MNNVTVETRYNENACANFNRYNEHTFVNAYVKIMLMYNAYNELFVITYEFSGSLELPYVMVDDATPLSTPLRMANVVRFWSSWSLNDRRTLLACHQHF